MKKETLTRKGLYDLIWSAPLSSLMKKYDTSYSELHKVCSEMNIPLPKAGYWQKLQHGKLVQVKLLPEDFSGKAQIELLIREEISTNSEKSESTLTGGTKSTSTKSKLPLKVPAKLQNPDPLIVIARNALVRQGWKVWPVSRHRKHRLWPAQDTSYHSYGRSCSSVYGHLYQTIKST